MMETKEETPDGRTILTERLVMAPVDVDDFEASFALWRNPQVRAGGPLAVIGAMKIVLRPTSPTEFVSNEAPGVFSLGRGGMTIDQPGQPLQRGRRVR